MLTVAAIASTLISLALKLGFLAVGLTVVRSRDPKAGWLVVSSALISIFAMCLSWASNVVGARTLGAEGYASYAIAQQLVGAVLGLVTGGLLIAALATLARSGQADARDPLVT